MTVDIEGYKAEQKLKQIGRMTITEQNKRRAELKRKKKERLAITEKIDLLQNELCDECRDRPSRGSLDNQCGCPAATQVRELGKRLGWEETKIGRPKGEKIEPNFDLVNEDNFTLEVYKEMKKVKVTDRDIMAKLGWYTMKLHEWKREHGLVAKHKQHKPKPGRNKKEVSPTINGMAIEEYEAYKEDKRSDAWICGLHGIPTSNLVRWKRAHGLSCARKPQQAAQTTIEDKGDECMGKEQNAVEVDYKEKYEKLQQGYDAMVLSKDETIQAQYDTLQKMQQDLADAQSAVGVEQHEYLKLVSDYKSLENENDRLKRMLDRLKHTETMNVMLMEQRVYLQRQMDEVMA